MERKMDSYRRGTRWRARGLWSTGFAVVALLLGMAPDCLAAEPGISMMVNGDVPLKLSSPPGGIQILDPKLLAGLRPSARQNEVLLAAFTTRAVLDAIGHREHPAEQRFVNVLGVAGAPGPVTPAIFAAVIANERQAAQSSFHSQDLATVNERLKSDAAESGSSTNHSAVTATSITKIHLDEPSRFISARTMTSTASGKKETSEYFYATYLAHGRLIRISAWAVLQSQADTDWLHGDLLKWLKSIHDQDGGFVGG